jgi:hypothetical protein
VEFVGTVTPGGYAGTITLLRNIVSAGQFGGAAGSTSVPPNNPPGPDNSDPLNRDDNPQPGGTVYDLDAPAIGPSGPGTIVRLRYNFLEYAVLASDSNNTQIGTLDWYSRTSCTKDPSDPTDTTAIFSTDVAGDNQAGSGTTNLSWNLQ